MENFFIIGCLHFAIALVLFVFINWIGRHSEKEGYMPISLIVREGPMPAFNFVFKVLTPVVALILLMTIFQKIDELNWLMVRCYDIVIFYWLVRFIFIVLTGRTRLMNWWLYFVYAICSIMISILVYKLVDKASSILPSPQGLVDQMWILIILFVYNLFNNLTLNREKTEQRKKNYIIDSYHRLKRRFGHVVDTNCSDFYIQSVVYAIMIYENFNRYRIARWIENLCAKICKGRKYTLGVMQVMTSKYISDEESIKIAIDKITHDRDEILSDGHTRSWRLSGIAQDLAEKYNGGDSTYANEIHDIWETIINRIKPSMIDMVYNEYEEVQIRKRNDE